MSILEDVKYSKTHEWIRVDGDRATIGITAHAAEELGEIVFLELPEVGRIVAAEEKLCEIESIKTTSEICAPVSGRIVQVNEDLADHPEVLNASPYGEGWIVIIDLSNKEQIDTLLTPADYKALLDAAD